MQMQAAYDYEWSYFFMNSPKEPEPGSGRDVAERQPAEWKLRLADAVGQRLAGVREEFIVG